MSKRIVSVALAIFFATIASAPALAQPGKGPMSPPGKSTHPNPGHGAQSAAGNLPVGTRTTGAWLDDATVLDPGSSWLAISWDDWRSPSDSQQFLPSANVSLGVTDRVQVQAAIPYQYGGGGSNAAGRGLGDVYAGVKIALTSPTSKVGFAVTPTAEILSSRYVTDGTSQVNWVLPASVEFRADPVRLYASAGYFTRGAVFVGGGIDGQVNDRVTLMASLTETTPTGTQLLADGTSARSQVDAGGGVYVTVTDRLTVFGNVGRTISELQADSTKSLVSVGVAINLRKGGAPVKAAK